MIQPSSPVSILSPIAKKLEKTLAKVGVNTIEDLLHHYPSRYVDLSNITPINKLIPGVLTTIKGEVVSIEDVRSKWKRMFITRAVVKDETGIVECVWFHQRFLTKVIKQGDILLLTGKPELSREGLKLTHPEYEKVSDDKAPIHGARIVPIYPLTERLTQKQLRFLIRIALGKTSISEWLPSNILKHYNLIPLKTALNVIHFPANQQLLAGAEHRLKFDELFLLQLRNSLVRKELAQFRAPTITFHESETRIFVDALPFELTKSQKQSAWEIIKDIQKSKPMNRLLHGDVGSGKTVVSSIPILNAILSGYQVAYMAPTEILAEQQFKTFCRLFEKQRLTIGLITSSGVSKFHELRITNYELRKDFLQEVLHGSINLIIGTHSLIQKDILFNNLGLAVVDEQHRFGVNQRAALVRRSTQIKTQINADNDFLYENLTYELRGAIFDVANSIGLGLKEMIYQKSLEEALRKKSLKFEKEKTIPVFFENIKVGSFKPDLIIEDKIIVELKSLPFIGKTEEKQLWSYLRGSSYKLALLVNFGTDKLDIKRVVYDTARETDPICDPRLSAFHPHESAKVLPHFLSMTATPIPRTLALTVYGNLDISVITEMPALRKPIITKYIPHEKRNDLYQHVVEELQDGRQAFIVCPLIDPSDKLGVKSATEELNKIKTIFHGFSIAILHGRQKAEEKNRIMSLFQEQTYHILVSTPVVEVGIDIPNATIMIIENAERFGLAQLHQLRGRVGRGEYQSYCYLLSDSESDATKQRLSAVIASGSGLALAEKDLELRGPGDAYGVKQSGYEDSLYIARLTDFPIIKETKQAAEQLVNNDPSFVNNRSVKIKVEELERKIHPE